MPAYHANEVREQDRRPEYVTMPAFIRRKPLPPSAKLPNAKRLSVLPGSDVHPTMRIIRCQEKYVRVSHEAAAQSPLFSSLLGYDFGDNAVLTPGSPHVYGDQLFAAMPYCGIKKDSEVWQDDGDCVVCIGGDVDLRIHSAIIAKNRCGPLIDRIQKLSDEESSDFTEATPFSETSIRYILELPAPSSPLDLERYRTSVRNFFAALRSKPIAGNDLVTELDQLYATAIDFLGVHDRPEKATQFVRKYVQRLKLDDCRHVFTNAVRILAWCERTRWEKGWVETFVHVVGMMGRGMRDYKALAELSQQTSELLQRSHRKQQQEISEMEWILSRFEIAGGVPSSQSGHTPGVRAAHAFQQFLRDYYSAQLGTWPPPTSSEHWLNRTLTQRLQEDVGNLYDVLVDNSVVYGHQQDEEKTTRLLRFHKDGSMIPLQATECASHFPLERTIAGWNSKCGFDAMPHPWPLLPKPMDTSNDGKMASLIPALHGKFEPSEMQDDLRDAYLQGVNPYVQPNHFSRAFLEHEASTQLDGVNTHDARLGRWLIVHCLMQLLSRVAVDTQGLWYCHGVPYFLNADLKHCPPWAGATIPATIRQANTQDSWCWLYARGVSEARQRRNRIRRNENPQPKFRINWDDEGRWQLSPTRKDMRQLGRDEKLQ